ncbi:cupin domain-containing protein [Mycobacterium sp. 360MFTsu5.1]|uniref:cupin domain-containing protein n=1 Tax=Mycobacterium sp. 360MFTsu5.1 TaxID=1172186 RepID=UPI0003724B6D|nr:cupin domain-containing protein [Mycobacterium sp. 360MFTsu5.1]
MTQLVPNTAIAAGTLHLEPSDVSEDQTVSGRPQTRSTVLGSIGGVEVGVWEMTAGSMCDIESEEIFIVLSGSAVVEFDDSSKPLHLAAGDVARLKAGTETVWTVSEPLRKVYLTSQATTAS